MVEEPLPLVRQAAIIQCRKEALKRMIKKTLIIVLLIVILIGVGVYMKDHAKTDLVVKIGGTDINNIALFNEDISSLVNKDMFSFAFKQGELSTIKYIQIGQTATLDFGVNQPDRILIEDDVLKPDGIIWYTDRETMHVPYTKDGKVYSFIIKKNLASGLYSGDIDNRKDYRGIRIIVYKDNTIKTYAFVIKTDA